MKLRNKKTGEIGELKQWWNRKNRNINGVGIYVSPDIPLKQYNSLAELNEEWEDYEEEPKEEWYINCTGEILENNKSYCNTITPEKLQSIGNYFETEEEAEKAVEKLKAWKRLRDKGFRFTAWFGGNKNIDYQITSLENETYIPRQMCDDLDLLFGGEE